MKVTFILLSISFSDTTKMRCEYKQIFHQCLGFYNVKLGAWGENQRITGKSSNIVDANLSVLRDKVEMLKTNERLERCCKCESGWNYVRVYDYKLKRDREISQFFEFVGIICGTLGFTCLSGIVCLCLVSFFVHLFQ
ncbi:uncharacterized protein LOC122307490 isoform X1 [Carya illinoinensis]|uniref:uncharacterized protein LOC122307490 isoform X1 n=1 Tax=Carya illinoinensis TaxID=32201 RepID=UPI001C71D94A|nr:uncharacterized protein LOC122307490 isoform X1 [Carya illinoinensis]